jgi:hypothetical protein
VPVKETVQPTILKELDFKSMTNNLMKAVAGVVELSRKISQASPKMVNQSW